MFGTGQFLGLPDISNANVQSIYGVYDPPAGYVTPLLNARISCSRLWRRPCLAQPRCARSPAPRRSIPGNKGWYIDLNLLSGERVINDPRLGAGGELVLTTYQPIPPMVGSCTAIGQLLLHGAELCNRRSVYHTAIRCER